MGNGYNNQLHRESVYQRSTFLPMLCRVSSKDVRISQYKNPSSTFSKEPSSPKISCTGQVKRNNKVVGFPTRSRLNSDTMTASTTTPTKSSVKYTKPTRNIVGEKPLKKSGDCNNDILQVNICEMDPPLPVIKKVCQPGGGRDEINLWKRRICAPVKNLQIDKQIYLPDNNHHQPTTI